MAGLSGPGAPAAAKLAHHEPASTKDRHAAHQRPRAHDGRHPGGGHHRVRRQGPGRCAHRRHCRGHAHQQAHDLLLLRQQGRPVRGGAGRGLPAHAQHRERTAPGRPATRRRAAPAGGLHRRLPAGPPRVHPPGDDREHPPRPVPGAEREHPRAERAGHRRAAAAVRARRGAGRVPRRHRPGGPAHVDQRAERVQRGQPAHLLADLPARPGRPARRGRPARQHRGDGGALRAAAHPAWPVRRAADCPASGIAA